MFENAELGQTVSKKDYRKEVPELRLELVQLQRRLLDADFPVIILISGLNCAGRSETVNLLNEWMDPRFLITEAYGPPTPEELAHPPYWRYWRDLPPDGRIALFMHAWYTHPMVDRFDRKIGRRKFEAHLDHGVVFEKLLADDGAVFLKFWMHLGRDRQKKRLKKLSKNPLQSWRVSPSEWDLLKRYDHYVEIAGDALERTSTTEAPWRIIDGADPRFRSLEVGRVIRDTIRARLDGDPSVVVDSPVGGKARAVPDSNDLGVPSMISTQERTVIGSLDMSLTVAKGDYERELAEVQGRINGLARRARGRELPVVALFEGSDAAGKGGAVRRLTAAMDAADYRVIPIAAPSDEERAHHYLWRFWRHLGRAGRMTIFDRSWYGRVLVERVEGFATRGEWRRAYAEINDFEEQLTGHGAVVLKFWIQITKDEQLARFTARESIPFKQWKLTDEDWRNREKWDLYAAAVEEMVERTSTSTAPWTLVEGNCKRHARLKVLGTVADALESNLGEDSERKREKKK